MNYCYPLLALARREVTVVHDVRGLCLSCEPNAIQLTVERVNPNAPLQFRLLCRLRVCWPNASTTCTDSLYQTIQRQIGVFR